MALLHTPRFTATARVSKPTTPVAPDPALPEDTQDSGGRTTAARYSAPASSRGLVIPARRANRRGVRDPLPDNRCPPPTAPSRQSPGILVRHKACLTRPNRDARLGHGSTRLFPAHEKYRKLSLIHSDTTDPRSIFRPDSENSMGCLCILLFTRARNLFGNDYQPKP